MGSALSLRLDLDGVILRRLARLTRDADQARRFLSLASIHDGGSRAMRVASVTVQIVRGWVARFNADIPDGLINGKAPGKSSVRNDEQLRPWRKPSNADRRPILMVWFRASL